MQPLYTEAEFKAAKPKQPLPLQCLHCAKTFYRTKQRIRIALNPFWGYKAKFCSHKCQRTHECPPVIVSCKQCHKTFKKLPCDIKATKHNFCSRSCAAKYNNAHKTKGTRVSKLEVWLSKQLPSLYPNLEFHFNRKDAINGELDIFIPSLKLAFELNGVFHFIPVFGQDKLAKMQNNDFRKVQACLEHNIELCIIDVSTQKYFKEQTSMKFLAIIQNIINAKLL